MNGHIHTYIPRQRKVIVLSNDSGEFLHDIESVREGNQLLGSLNICTPSLGR